LPAGALNYVLSLEENDWFDPKRISELAVTYDSNHTSTEKRKYVSSVYVASTGSKSSNMNGNGGRLFGQTFQAAKGQQSSKDMMCYNCQKNGHVARFCPLSSDARQNSQTTSRSPDKS